MSYSERAEAEGIWWANDNVRLEVYDSTSITAASIGFRAGWQYAKGSMLTVIFASAMVGGLAGILITFVMIALFGAN